MKKDFIEIKTTFDKLISAKKMAKFLIENELVACAQISKISSFYIYEKKFTNQNEFLLILKTKKRLYHKIKKVIIDTHNYKTPEIITLKIEDGLESYLKWIDSSISDS